MFCDVGIDVSRDGKLILQFSDRREVQNKVHNLCASILRELATQIETDIREGNSFRHVGQTIQQTSETIANALQSLSLLEGGITEQRWQSLVEQAYNKYVSIPLFFSSQQIEEELLAQEILGELLHLSKSNGMEEVRSRYNTTVDLVPNIIHISQTLEPKPVEKAVSLIYKLRHLPTSTFTSTPLPTWEKKHGIDSKKDLETIRNTYASLSQLDDITQVETRKCEAVKYIANPSSPTETVEDVTLHTLMLCNHFGKDSVIYLWINLCTLHFYVGKAMNYKNRTVDHVKESCGITPSHTHLLTRYLRYYGCRNFLVIPIRRLSVEEDRTGKFDNKIETIFINRLSSLWPNGYNTSVSDSDVYYPLNYV